MKNVVWAVLCGLTVCAAVGCGHSGDTEATFPAGFDRRSDAEKVAYVMEQATPDSVARFICRASLGQVPGAHIDTMATATLYAYENYADSALATFSDELDRFSESLPLTERMRILAMAGMVDAQGLGYELGLHYVDQIRMRKMTTAQVRDEIEALRSACKDDPKTFDRFLTGFKTVLRMDRGKDLSAEIYESFINYD